MMILVAQPHPPAGPVLGFLGVLLGALCTIFGVLSFWKSLTVKDWTPVKGTVLRSKVRYLHGYQPRVRYRYSFGELSRDSSQLRLVNRGYFFKRTAQAIVSKYIPHAPVTVWVNPRNPKDAVLEPIPQPFAALFYAGLGLFFVWIGLSDMLG